jgi:hypothetical protein
VPTTTGATVTLHRGLQIDAVMVRPITPRRWRWRAQDGFEEFERFLGVLSGIMNDGDLAILTAGMNAYGPPPDPPNFGTKEKEYNDSRGYYPFCLAVTLPGSASVALSDLPAKCRPSVPKPWGRVVGKRQRIHQLATHADPNLGDTPLIAESIPLPKDNRVFQDLLARAPFKRYDPDDPSGVNRKLLTFGIGQRVGWGHNLWIFDEDLHEGNFFMGADGKVVWVDYDNCCSYRPLSALQAATTMLPLLSSFSRADWFWFKRGYVSERGAAGREVVELIDPDGP